MELYILKIQGSGKIRDHLQIRDEKFALLAYFKVSSPKSALARCNLADKMDLIMEAAGKIPYGKIEKLTF
jgi:hypothetical protein